MSPALEVLCFQVGAQVFAVDIMSIREILRRPTVTPVPNAPPAVAGVLNLRGDLLPVVDLHQALLHQPAAGGADEVKLVVVQAAGCVAGLQVDQVLDVISLDAAELHPVPGRDGTGDNAVVAAFRREIEGQGLAVVLLLRLATLLQGAGIDTVRGRRKAG